MTDTYLPTYLQASLYGWLAVALLISMYTDIARRRIPNVITLPTVLIALLVYGFSGGVDGLLFSISGLGLCFAAFFPPYCMGGMGAGDVKLMCGVGAVLGFHHSISALLFIAVAGGILAIGFMIHRRNFKETISGMFVSLLFLGAHREASVLKANTIRSAKHGVPFGAAIACGVYFYFIYLISRGGTLPSIP